MIGNFFSGERGWVLPIAATALLACAVLSASPAVAAPTGTCITTQVAAPYRLPDGILRQAGTLTLCDTEAFTPVSDLHLVLVDGRRVGMFLSRRRTTEASADVRPAVMFERDAGGSLDLIGYILPTSGRSIAYQLRPSPVRPPADAVAGASGSGTGSVLAAVVAAGVR